MPSRFFFLRRFPYSCVVCRNSSCDGACPLAYPMRFCAGSEFRVQGAGFRVQGAGFRVQGSPPAGYVDTASEQGIPPHVVPCGVR